MEPVYSVAVARADHGIQWLHRAVGSPVLSHAGLRSGGWAPVLDVGPCSGGWARSRAWDPVLEVGLCSRGWALFWRSGSVLEVGLCSGGWALF